MVLPRRVEGVGERPTPRIYPFYGTPDGENCLQKTYYYTKYATIGGAVFSVYEMAFLSQPTTIRAGIARFGRFTLPFAGMGFVFGTSLCFLGKLRKKNDVCNHLLAGMAAGSVWGFKFNRISIGHVWAVYIGFIAAYFKFFSVHNLPIFNFRNLAHDVHCPKMDLNIKLYEDPGRPREG